MRRLLVPFVALVVVPSALAASSLTVTISTGSPVTAPGVTLNGVDQTSTFAVASSVAYTGGGNTLGWNLTAEAAAPTVSGNSLPFLVVTGVTRGNCTGGGCVNPANSIVPPVTVDTTPARIYNAAPSTGQGTVAVTATFQMSYPANAFTGTYSTVITLAVATGP
jgi:hypothetical protein